MPPVSPFIRLFIAGCIGLAAQGIAVADGPVARIRHDSLVRKVAAIEKGRALPPVDRRFDVVVLENAHLAITVCPALGERIVRLVDKATGRQLLYEGVIRYSGTALSEGGGSGGGIQINHPYYHAGSSYVVPLPYTTEVQADGTAVLTMACTAYPHLQRTVWRIRLAADEAAFRTDYRFENLAPFAMGFNPWISAAFPLRKDVQFILPTEWVSGHWFGITDEERNGNWLRPWPIAEDGRDWSHLVACDEPSVFSYGITDGYTGICFHDTNDGLVRVFDPAVMPGAKAAGKWREKSDGWDWVEIWGACSHNMEDPLWLAPHESFRASDLWFPFHGIGGLTWAGENGGIHLRKDGGKLTCGLFVPRDSGRCSLRLTTDGEPLVEADIEARPDRPFLRTVACPLDADDVRLTVVDAAGRTLLRHQKFFGPRPRKVFPERPTPWHRRSPFTRARWEEAFTPLMAWGPWYHPPTSYSKLLEKDPDDAAALLGRARSLLKEANGNLFRARPSPSDTLRSEAVDLLARLAALPGSHAERATATSLLGLAQFQQGDRDAAEKTFAEAAESSAGAPLADYFLALIAAGEGDWPLAAARAEAAVARANDDTLARLLVATASIELNRPEKADEILAPVLDADPLDVAAVSLARRAADRRGRDAEVRRLDARLKDVARLSPGQFRAGEAILERFRSGRDIDCLAGDTILGPSELPGTEP